MNKETSVYLDALRFLAALAVFFSHVGARLYGGGFLWQAIRLGAPAVVVFFVLSGFVIAYVSERRETSVRDYAASRAARIYSVVVPTLLLTAGLDLLGSRIDAAPYENVNQLIGAGAWNLPALLSFLQMSWVNGSGITPGSDGAYWSLGYEVIYYALFGFGYYCRGFARIAGCAALGLIAGPHIIGLFPIWLLGLAAYRACGRIDAHPRIGWCVFVMSAAFMVVWITFADVSPDLAEHRAGEIGKDYALAVAFSANLVGFHAVSNSFGAVVRWIGRPVRWLAGATFTLYLLHLPLIVFVKAAAPWPMESWQFRTALIGLPLIVVFCVAQVTERRKQGWRSLIDWIFDGVAIWIPRRT